MHVLRQAVLNTNYLALVSQNNLTKSQSALGTAIERLSSGMRINSAKDDAAGQAIANRFTANIKGLTQAARNANDGISIAQTTEGSLNEINNNLQRIRELSVQAANGSNSQSDLDSIQAEIKERLDEIDRVSRETQFNGKYVLGKDANEVLSVQVGAHDSQRIDIQLSKIDSTELNLSSYNVNGTQSSALSDSLTKAGQGVASVTVSINANEATPPTGPTGANPSGVTATAIHTSSASSSGFAVLASNGEYYELVENSKIAGQYTWDSSTAALDAADVGDVATQVARTVAAPAITVVDAGGSPTGDSGEIVVTNFGNSTLTFETAGIYQRNDKVGTDGLAEYAVKADDGNYYELTATRDAATDTITFTIDEDALVQISANNVNTTAAVNVEIEMEAPPASVGDLYNEDLTIPTVAGTGVYALTDGSGSYAVKGSNGNYYAANIDGDGNVSWDSSAGAIDKADVDQTTMINQIDDAPVTGSYTGLNGGTLHSYEDADGKTQYVIKTGTGNDAVYTKATLGKADTTTGDIAVTKQQDTDGNDILLSVRSTDPLAALDDALQQVDNLRSHLGAIQNRFESTIANLNNTVNNLSAARSRIEDADYAVEVSNMTRAQILQQAGTSVLAQANQVPQTVLSLLR